MNKLLKEIYQCQLCSPDIAPRPVLTASRKSKVVIIGQAPGRKVHETGIPWDDKSGDNLRRWLGVSKEIFYDSEIFALIPMGFCYPGTGKSGDLPPRKECAPKWHSILLDQLTNVQLTILIGQYAQKYYLKSYLKDTLTKTVKSFEEYLPDYFVLPHPSPRNNIWQRKNPWFDQEVLPILQEKIKYLT